MVAMMSGCLCGRPAARFVSSAWAEPLTTIRCPTPPITGHWLGRVFVMGASCTVRVALLCFGLGKNWSADNNLIGGGGVK